MAPKKPKPFDVGTVVAKKAGGGARIGKIIKTIGAKKWEVQFFDDSTIERLKTQQLVRPKEPPAEAAIPAESVCVKDEDPGDGLNGDVSDDDNGFDFLPDEDDADDDCADDDSADEFEENADDAEAGDEDNEDDDNADEDNADEDNADNSDDADDNYSADEDDDQDDADNADDDNASYADDEGSLLTPAPIDAQARSPTDDDEDGDDEDSIHRANNTIEEDEIERENEDDDEIGVNRFEIEDLDVHGRKWQAYIQEKEQLLESELSVVKEPHKVKLGVGVRVQEKGGDQQKGEIVEHVTGRTWLVQFDGGSGPPERKTSTQVKAIIDPYIWKIKRDSKPTNAPEEYKDIGLINHNFEVFSESSLKSKEYKCPFFDLLLRFWPGHWQDQLRNLNLHIEDENVDRAKNKKVGLVSENEFWKFVGVLIAAAPLGKGGVHLWEKKVPGERTCSDPIDFGPSRTGGRNIFPLYRFKQIKAAFPHAFENGDAKSSGDPWYPIGLLVDGFNDNRSYNFAASYFKVLDESMSAYRPRTTQYGGLPHLSFIGRKPEPLGTEFKVSNCQEK
jgi:hypothetical protein